MAFMADPRGRHYGYKLMQQSGVRSGALYPMLSKFLAKGWVTDGWENDSPDARRGRPARRYYELTDAGRGELASAAAFARRKGVALKEIRV